MTDPRPNDQNGSEAAEPQDAPNQGVSAPDPAEGADDAPGADSPE